MPEHGETRLPNLLADMQPVLMPDVYVFVSLDSTAALPSDLSPRMQFAEEEGVTVIVTRLQAKERGWSYTFASRMITLNVHSSLAAVGFLATITQALADEGMGVNPVSAFYHDHLFVPVEDADKALEVLHRLQQSGSDSSVR